MDRKTLLAITLCFLIFAVWQKYYLEPQNQQRIAYQQSLATAQNPAATPGTSVVQKQSESSLSATTAAAPAKPETKTLVSKTGELSLSNGPKFISSWNLSAFHQGIKKDSATINLDTVINRSGILEIAFNDPAYAYITQAVGSFSEIPSGVLWTYEDANLKLTREITTTPETPYLDVKVNAQFKGAAPTHAFISVGSQSLQDDTEEQDRQLLYWTNDTLERPLVKDVTELKEVKTPVKYVGATNRYFLFALMNQAPEDPLALLQPQGNGAAKINMVYPIVGKTFSVPMHVYFGPKDLELLRSVNPLLDHALDLGWFTVVAYPLLTLLKWFYGFFKNYGIAIILLTLVVRLATYPLTYKSMKSMKDMARVQPQIQKIREKHKNDKEALNREMMTFMKSHGYNPMAGCLPILIQMPVFFALYRVLYGSVELYHAPFALWITDLSAKDPFYVTPVLLSATMFLQQKLTPSTAMDPMQQKMLQFMPLLFGVFMITLPSGLTLYMLVSALAGIVQQLILNKKLGLTPAPVTAAK